MIISTIKYFYQRKIQPGFKIKKNALVVDIGSGDKPFWRSDVFVDDLSMGDVQRASHTKTIHNIGTFIDGNVLNLPFKDKTFDFSFCSHLLEHVEDPVAAITEIMRISKSGYIEVPNGILETIKPFVSHIWFIYRSKNKLIFVRKSKKMHDILSGNGLEFMSVTRNVKDPFIRLYWKNKIHYEIIDQYKESEKYFSPKFIKVNKDSGSNLYMVFVKIMRFFFYQEKKIPTESILKNMKNKFT